MNESKPDEKVTRKVIFVMGSGHSGSTLLDLTLGSHSRGFSLGEFSTLCKMVKNGKLQTAICKICGENCVFWTNRVSISILESYFGWGNSGSSQIVDKVYSRFGSIRRNIYRDLFQWTGASVLIDSSKSISWIRRQLLPFWHWRDQDPILIYICRDGRAVVNSYLRKYPEKDIHDAVRGWVTLTEKMEEFFRDFRSDMRIRVSYESLATDSERILSSLCAFLRIDYEPGMLEYWKHEHHVLQSNSRARSPIVRYQKHMARDSIEGSSHRKDSDLNQSLGLGIKLDLKWKDELSAENLEIFEKIAGSVNRHYAYEEK
ncbi:sulfotransferase [bacterium]|nr:sulfotransferase [bacterium]